MKDQRLAGLDEALVRLRRLWSSPRQMIVDHDGAHIEMSSVLVVEACARGANRGAEISVGDIAQFADVQPSTASRLVDRAVQAGLVLRSPSRTDARRIALELTAAGAALRERSVTSRRQWLGAVVEHWTTRDLEALTDLLSRFADAVATAGEPLHEGQSPTAAPPASM